MHQAHRGIVTTMSGLLLALLALPLVSWLFRTALDITETSVVVGRELSLFACGVILLLLMRRDGLSLQSIGVGTAPAGRTLLRALLIMILVFAAAALGMVLMQVLDLPFGSGGKGAALPVWTTILIVLRAGVLEEFFYRGYAIERLLALTNNRWIAGLAPLTAFALAHYRQGSGGILLAFLMGAVLTAAYFRTRDLLALMAAHFAVNFIMNVVLPALG